MYYTLIRHRYDVQNSMSMWYAWWSCWFAHCTIGPDVILGLQVHNSTTAIVSCRSCCTRVQWTAARKLKKLLPWWNCGLPIYEVRSEKNVKFHHIIKFHKVLELFQQRRVRTVRTGLLLPYASKNLFYTDAIVVTVSTDCFMSHSWNVAFVNCECFAWFYSFTAFTR